MGLLAISWLASRRGTPSTVGQQGSSAYAVGKRTLLSVLLIEPSYTLPSRWMAVSLPVLMTLQGRRT